MIYKKIAFALRGLDRTHKINLAIGVPILMSLLVIGACERITDEFDIGGMYGIDPLNTSESWFVWFIVIMCIMCFEWVLFSNNSVPLDVNDGTRLSSHAEKTYQYSLGCHPWRRYFARMVDIVVIGSLAGLVFIMFSMVFLSSFFAYIDNYNAEAKMIYFLILFSFIYIPFEALFLYTVGTTPGKFIFGISIKPENGAKIRFTNALERTLSVWAKGFAFGIPAICIITMLYSYSKLKKNGITSWDKDNNIIVTHRVWGFWRYLFSTVSVVFSFIILVIIRDMPK